MLLGDSLQRSIVLMMEADSVNPDACYFRSAEMGNCFVSTVKLPVSEQEKRIGLHTHNELHGLVWHRSTAHL